MSDDLLPAMAKSALREALERGDDSILNDVLDDRDLLGLSRPPVGVQEEHWHEDRLDGLAETLLSSATQEVRGNLLGYLYSGTVNNVRAIQEGEQFGEEERLTDFEEDPNEPGHLRQDPRKQPRDRGDPESWLLAGSAVVHGLLLWRPREFLTLALERDAPGVLRRAYQDARAKALEGAGRNPAKAELVRQLDQGKRPAKAVEAVGGSWSPYECFARDVKRELKRRLGIP